MFDTCLSAFGVASSPQSNILVSWVHPSSGFVKLNTDSSSLGNSSIAGYGGLIRGEGGLWIFFIFLIIFLGLIICVLSFLPSDLVYIWPGSMALGILFVKWIVWRCLGWCFMICHPFIGMWLLLEIFSFCWLEISIIFYLMSIGKIIKLQTFLLSLGLWLFVKSVSGSALLWVSSTSFLLT